MNGNYLQIFVKKITLSIKFLKFNLDIKINIIFIT